MTGPDFRITHANQSLADMLGYSPMDLVGEHVLEIVGPHNIENAGEQLEAHSQGFAVPYHLDAVPGRGRRVSVLIQPIPILDPVGSFLGGLAIVELTEPEKLRQEQAVSLARTAHRMAELSRALDPLQRCGVDGLSARETEVADLLVSGKVPKEVACALYISLHTVRNHVKSIYRKLGIHSQVELFAKMSHR